MTDRAEFCEWCTAALPREGRKDRRTCSRSCRQALQRFRVAPAAGAAGAKPLRFAYADPPYPGLAKRYYSHDPNCAEVDHAALIADLMARYPEGWALSTSAAALREVLILCPPGVRVAIWVKGSRSGESWRARNAYEPVILWGGRPRKMAADEDLDDVLIWGGRQHSHPDALVGMKPAPFAEWVFRQLGALAGDYLTDVFPGSGAIMRAWQEYGGRDPNEQETTASPRLPFEDIVLAPPASRNRVGSRLEEATQRLIDDVSGRSSTRDSSPISRVLADCASSMGLPPPDLSQAAAFDESLNVEIDRMVSANSTAPADELILKIRSLCAATSTANLRAAIAEHREKCHLTDSPCPVLEAMEDAGKTRPQLTLIEGGSPK